MRIGELADQAGVGPKTLRYYESIGLLPEPPRTSSGYRDYGPEAVTRVAFVRRAQASGMSLREIGHVLAIRDAGERPCEHVKDLLVRRAREVSARIEELERMHDDLRALSRRAERLDPAACSDAEICHILTGQH